MASRPPRRGVRRRLWARRDATPSRNPSIRPRPESNSRRLPRTPRARARARARASRLGPRGTARIEARARRRRGRRILAGTREGASRRFSRLPLEHREKHRRRPTRASGGGCQSCRVGVTTQTTVRAASLGRRLGRRRAERPRASFEDVERRASERDVGVEASRVHRLGTTRILSRSTPEASKTAALHRVGTHTSRMAFTRRTCSGSSLSVSNMVLPTTTRAFGGGHRAVWNNCGCHAPGSGGTPRRRRRGRGGANASSRRGRCDSGGGDRGRSRRRRRRRVGWRGPRGRRRDPRGRPGGRSPRCCTRRR